MCARCESAFCECACSACALLALRVRVRVRAVLVRSVRVCQHCHTHYAGIRILI